MVSAVALAVVLIACRAPQPGGVRRVPNLDAAVEDASSLVTTCEQLSCTAPAQCKESAGKASCACPSGYMTDPDDPKACQDIDECASSASSQNDCDPNARCDNLLGEYHCTCNDGYTGSGKLCRSLGDCAGAAVCHPDATCMRIGDGVQCECVQGFEGDGKLCVDQDECTAGTAMCGDHSHCVNLRSGYDCACDVDFFADDQKQCRDACELAQADSSLCDPSGHGRCSLTADGTARCTSCLPDAVGSGKTCTANATCAALECGPNTICSGSPSACACAPGFRGAASAGCDDIDECAEGSDGCDGSTSQCRNTVGGFVCDCLSGFDRVGSQCVNIDECARQLDLCDPSATCTDTEGSYTCACKPGFTGDGRGCQDIDECEDKTASCAQDSTVTCQNTAGGYDCVCPTGYAGDGKSEACYCDLSGYWAVRQSATLILPERAAGNVVLIEGSETHATIWELHRYSYEGDTLHVEKRQCGSDKTPEIYSPLYMETYSSSTPNDVFDTMGYQRTVDVPLPHSAALPGKPFVTPRDALVQGIKLDDPVNDPWPKTYKDVADSVWVDSDNDGEPGLTLWPKGTTVQAREGNGTLSYLPVQLQGDSTLVETRTGCVSTAVRAIGHLDGSINACTRLMGKVISDKTEGRVHSCTQLRMSDWDTVDVTCKRADWAAARKCSDEQVKFLDNQDQTSQASADFESIKLGDLTATDLDCASVREKLPALP